MRQRRPRTDDTNHGRGGRLRVRARRPWRAARLVALLAAVPVGLGMLGMGAAGAWGSGAGGSGIPGIGSQPFPMPGPATTTLPGTLLEGGFTDEGATTYFAYATAGDEVSARIASTARTPVGARVVVTDPTGAVVHDDAVPAAIAGTHVGGTWTATVDGVWTIAVIDPFVGAGGEASFAWDLGVVRDGASIPGRVWTESLAIHTPDETDIVLYAASAQGALYRVALDGYDGVDSTLRVNDVGNALVGTCEPAGSSVPMPHSPEAGGLGAGYWQPSASDCDGLSAYRLFLDPPAADLPASTDAWADGRVDDRWLTATYESPTIEGLAFARDAAGSNAGTLTGTLAGQPGVVRVAVDVDGDGGHDGPLDVVDEVAVLEPGPFSWAWDGLDASGAPVPVTATGVTMHASLEQASPIHFLRIDAETSAGGIEVEAITGPAPGVTTLHWDDTLLEPSSDERWTRTEALIGSDPASSSAGGVHRWESGGEHPNQNDGVRGSWGDQRAIDDWAFIADHAEAVVALAPLSDVRIDKRVDVEAALALDGSSATVQWTIEVGNHGPVAAPGVVVADDYPAELDVASLVVVAPPTQGAFDAATGVWIVGDLAPSAVASVTVQGVVATTPGTAATVVNAATVTSGHAPEPTGTCTPNDGLEADDDRCDRVATPLVPAPAPPATEHPTASEPPAVTAPAPEPTPRNRGEREPLPETGASLDGGLAIVGAAVLVGGIVALAWRRRRRRA